MKATERPSLPEMDVALCGLCVVSGVWEFERKGKLADQSYLLAPPASGVTTTAFFRSTLFRIHAKAVGSAYRLSTWWFL